MKTVASLTRLGRQVTLSSVRLIPLEYSPRDGWNLELNKFHSQNGTIACQMSPTPRGLETTPDRQA
jgi:hypothetical protein